MVLERRAERGGNCGEPSRCSNGIFTTLGLEKHPNKTFIGRVEKGFDFLGYCLWPDRLTVAQATVERFLARVTRLYEQEQGRPLRSAPLGS